jgi:hypothetical protein
MASKECSFETCTKTTLRGEKFCPDHNHIIALQSELERIRTLIPLDLRALKAGIGPELENLLSSLARLVVSADPSRASSFGGGSPSARLKDAWAGQSMLDERGNHTVTHRGAADTSYTRTVLIPRYRTRLQSIADDIIDALNPSLDPRPKVRKPRCRRRGCALYDKGQDPGNRFCGKCGSPFPDPEESENRDRNEF